MFFVGRGCQNWKRNWYRRGKDTRLLNLRGQATGPLRHNSDKKMETIADAALTMFLMEVNGKWLSIYLEEEITILLNLHVTVPRLCSSPFDSSFGLVLLLV
ncbi:hypothetical protein Droror1_Dr00002738 [Drosera rotundifolia]